MSGDKYLLILQWQLQYSDDCPLPATGLSPAYYLDVYQGEEEKLNLVASIGFKEQEHEWKAKAAPSGRLDVEGEGGVGHGGGELLLPATVHRPPAHRPHPRGESINS